MVFMVLAVKSTLPRRSKSLRFAAFTLAELMVAAALLSFGVVGSIQALLRLNHNATLSRLQTGASSIAQNRIDRILSDGPFKPIGNPPQIPASLTLGTTAIGTAANPVVPIYTNPATDVAEVEGWMTIELADASTVVNTRTVPIYRATVTVNYQFRGRDYAVQLNTARASD